MSKLFTRSKIYEKEELQQGSEEWLKVRQLKFTASNADVIYTNGKGLDTLTKEMLADYFSSQEFEEYIGKFKSPDMQRGNDYEEVARMAYELETGNEVKEVGFVERSEHIGCSPDGIVENGNGLIEIKLKTTPIKCSWN